MTLDRVEVDLDDLDHNLYLHYVSGIDKFTPITHHVGAKRKDKQKGTPRSANDKLPAEEHAKNTETGGSSEGAMGAT